MGRFRTSLLESLLLALPRSAYHVSSHTTDANQRQEEAALGFVYLEGLRRVVLEFGRAGCGLVRFLRPLTQVLVMQPLEDGGAADRHEGLCYDRGGTWGFSFLHASIDWSERTMWPLSPHRIIALRTLVLVLGQCAPMAHQLAHETLAQILRLYVTIVRCEGCGRARGKHDEVILALCRHVGVALAGACAEQRERRRRQRQEEEEEEEGGGEGAADSLRAWVASLAAHGCKELEGFWEEEGPVEEGGVVR